MDVNSDRVDKRGYLLEEYRLFHLKDQEGGTFEYHYHEFHKVILFLSGSVTYRVEGRGYRLRSGDVLLVPAHAIHQPVIRETVPYERIILWIQPEALERRKLDICFTRCREEKAYLLPRESYDREKLSAVLNQLEESRREEAYAADVLSEALFWETMVYLTRWVVDSEVGRPVAVRSDPKIDEILSYINAHLTEDLSVDALSERFYLSRSWLMHRFKSITGCTVHQYVQQKRLILAARLLRSGQNVTQAADQSGFSDYSTFLRAFRKTYGVSPSEF